MEDREPDSTPEEASKSMSKGFADTGGEFVHPTDSLPVPTMIDASDDPESAVTEVFRGGVIEAAQAIVNLATGNDDISRKQLDAAKYVVERVIGGIKNGQPLGEGSPADKLIMRINAEAARMKAESEGPEQGNVKTVTKVDEEVEDGEDI